MGILEKLTCKNLVGTKTFANIFQNNFDSFSKKFIDTVTTELELLNEISLKR